MTETHRLACWLYSALLVSGVLTVLSCAEPPEPPAVAEVPSCDSLATIELLRAPHCRVALASAHRGDRASGPENSTTSVVGAPRHRIRLVELDVRRSSDGVFFLFHDKTFSPRNVCSEQRGQWGRFADSLTSQELSHLFLPPDCTERIATLDEVFAAVRPIDLVLQLDLKGDSVRSLPDLISAAKKADVLQKIIIQLEHPDLIRAIRDVYPEVGILARCFKVEDVQEALKSHPEIVQVDSEMLSDELVALVREGGARILVKSVGATDEPVKWSNLLSQGVSIVLTDRATEMSEMMVSMTDGVRVPRLGGANQSLAAAF